MQNWSNEINFSFILKHFIVLVSLRQSSLQRNMAYQILDIRYAKVYTLHYKMNVCVCLNFCINPTHPMDLFKCVILLFLLTKCQWLQGQTSLLISVCASLPWKTIILWYLGEKALNRILEWLWQKRSTVIYVRCIGKRLMWSQQLKGNE